MIAESIHESTKPPSATAVTFESSTVVADATACGPESAWPAALNRCAVTSLPPSGSTPHAEITTSPLPGSTVACTPSTLRTELGEANASTGPAIAPPPASNRCRYTWSVVPAPIRTSVVTQATTKPPSAVGATEASWM